MEQGEGSGAGYKNLKIIKKPSNPVGSRFESNRLILQQPTENYPYLLPSFGPNQVACPSRFSTLYSFPCRMKLLSLILLVVLVAWSCSMAEAVKIMRCNKSPIGGNIWDNRATKACGKELELYCYNYRAKPYCETATEEISENFKECCKQKDREGTWEVEN
ncbi:Killer cell lectin-like receptor subfamily B member 1B allele B [Folsomia candida]|uniref:Killer cell lectin-like receptor subfamily B member 1B allele B n=1 Tax=Folsomia candida TaxID=158441 RepID=A0A226D280_FOLCA|nr:Killer cell lectin-like receptor subfamily B member 1B allele B [Folsomia candida]